MLVVLIGIDAYFHLARCCVRGDLADVALRKLELAAGITVGFYLLQRFIAIPMVCRKRYRQNAFFYRDASFEADEVGFRYRTSKTQSEWKWSERAGDRENAGAFLFYPSKSFAHIVPKRLFSDEDAATLKGWIENKVKRL